MGGTIAEGQTGGKAGVNLRGKPPGLPAHGKARRDLSVFQAQAGGGFR